MKRPAPLRGTVALMVTLLLGGCAEPGPQLVERPATSPSALLIRSVAVMDVETGTVTSDQDVWVTGGRITGIAPAGNAPALPGVLELDGAGATLLPGLIDMHGHVIQSSAPRWVGGRPDPEANLRSYLYCGVTTVLDPGALETQIFVLRERVASGELPGPRIYAAGPMVTAPGGHPVPIFEQLAPWWIRWYLVPRYTRQVETAEQARQAVQSIAALGADVIKLSVDRIPEQTPRIRREAVAAAAEAAGRLNLRAVAHIGSVEDAVDTGDAGVALWVHGVYKERIPDEHIAPLAAYGIPMVPTIEVYENYALLGQGPRVPTALERETVPADILEAFNHPPTAPSRAGEFFGPWLAQLRTARPEWHDNVRRLRAAGVIMLAGSDTQSGVFPGPGLHRELQHLVAAGMTPAEAIRAATLDAARFLAGEDDPDFGMVAPGKRADLLLVEGDPTTDLQVLSRIRTVIKDGVPLVRTPL
jgi:imidazolonepropionase-like amidohydrolase